MTKIVQYDFYTTITIYILEMEATSRDSSPHLSILLRW